MCFLHIIVSIGNLTWTLLSDRDSLQQVNYTISWEVEGLQFGVEWRENGSIVIDSSTHFITNTSLEGQGDIFNLTVLLTNITSSLNYFAVFNRGSLRIASDTIAVHGKCYYYGVTKLLTSVVPTGPPTIEVITIISRSEICVHWTPLKNDGADGYVIVYNDGNSDNSSTNVIGGGNIDQARISSLTEEHYTIRMVSYLELPSMLSDPVEVWLTGEGIIQI